MITTLGYRLSNKRERRREEVIDEQWTLAFVLSPFKFYHLISECTCFKRERRRKGMIGEQWTAAFRHLTTKHEEGEGWEGEMREGRGMGR